MLAPEALDWIRQANTRAREAIEHYLLSEEDGWPDAHLFAALQAQQEALQAAEQLLSVTIEGRSNRFGSATGP